MVVERGAVLSMGVFIGASTKIVDRETGEVHVGRVPAYSVVVPGSLPGKPLPDGSPGPNLYCAVIIKKVDERTRSKVSINGPAAGLIRPPAPKVEPRGAGPVPRLRPALAAHLFDAPRVKCRE